MKQALIFVLMIEGLLILCGTPVIRLFCVLPFAVTLLVWLLLPKKRDTKAMSRTEDNEKSDDTDDMILLFKYRP